MALVPAWTRRAVLALTLLTLAGQGLAATIPKALEPSWSPDGKELVFASSREGNMEIYSVVLKTGKVTRLTDNPGVDRAPAWSPDGKSIAFCSALGGGGIYVMAPDGKGQKRVTTPEEEQRDDAPSWAPGSDRLVFTRTQEDGDDIWVVNVDGTGAANLTNSPDASEAGPRWSPDGNHVAYFVPGDGLWVMNADGSGRRQVLAAKVCDAPTWSPDGARLAYAEGTGQIHIVNLDGSGDTVVSAARSERNPAWSPDGKQLAFTVREGGMSIETAKLPANLPAPGGTAVAQQPAGGAAQPAPAAAGGAQPTAGEVTVQMRELYRALSKAMHERNVDGVSALLAPGFVAELPDATVPRDAFLTEKVEAWAKGACQHFSFVIVDATQSLDGQTRLAVILDEFGAFQGARFCLHTWTKSAGGPGWVLATAARHQTVSDAAVAAAFARGERHLGYSDPTIIPTPESLRALYETAPAREIKARYEAWAAAYAAGRPDDILALLAPTSADREAFAARYRDAFPARAGYTRQTRSESRAILRIVPSDDGAKAEVTLIDDGLQKHEWERDARGQWLLVKAGPIPGACRVCVAKAEQQYSRLGGTPIEAVWRPDRLLADPTLDHWAYAAVDSVRRLRIMTGFWYKGYPDSGFFGEMSATRYHVANALCRLLTNAPADALPATTPRYEVLRNPPVATRAVDSVPDRNPYKRMVAALETKRGFPMAGSDGEFWGSEPCERGDLALWVACATGIAQTLVTNTLYVSDAGNDAWSGTKPQAADGDGPLQTLDRARWVVQVGAARREMAGPVKVVAVGEDGKQTEQAIFLLDGHAGRQFNVACAEALAAKGIALRPDQPQENLADFLRAAATRYEVAYMLAGVLAACPAGDALVADTPDAKWFAEHAPGWALHDCPRDDQLPRVEAEYRGKPDVLCTHPLRADAPCVLWKRVALPAGKTAFLRATVSHIAGDWQLIVRVNGKDLLEQPVGPDTVSADGWLDVTVDLSAYAGQEVLVEALNQATGWWFEYGYWAKIEVVSGEEGAAPKVVYLSDLKPVSSTQGWGQLQADRHVEGAKPLTVGGNVYDKGLGTHAPAEIVYQIPDEGFTRFAAVVGIDSHIRAESPGATCTFAVLVDGEEAFRSDVVRAGAAGVPVDVDVTDAAELRLIVTDAGDGGTADHADWADARLIAGEGADAAPTPGGVVRDPALERALLQALGMAKGPILATHLAAIKGDLNLSQRGIIDISGLEALTEVTSLDLGRNAIADLSPLAGLTGLQRLQLGGNPVLDIAPLGHLAGLQELALDACNVADLRPFTAPGAFPGIKHIWLWGDTIDRSEGSEALKAIEALKARRVSVEG